MVAAVSFRIDVVEGDVTRLRVDAIVALEDVMTSSPYQPIPAFSA